MGLFSSKKNRGDIPDSWLSDDELWFAAVHGLPLQLILIQKKKE